MSNSRGAEAGGHSDPFSFELVYGVERSTMYIVQVEKHPPMRHVGVVFPGERSKGRSVKHRGHSLGVMT